MPRSSLDAPASVPSCWSITIFLVCAILPQMNRQPMCIWMVKLPFTQYISAQPLGRILSDRRRWNRPPVMVFMAADFPAPLGPGKPQIPPLSMVRLMPNPAVRPPDRSFRCSISIKGIPPSQQDGVIITGELKRKLKASAGYLIFFKSTL